MLAHSCGYVKQNQIFTFERQLPSRQNNSAVPHQEWQLHRRNGNQDPLRPLIETQSVQLLMCITDCFKPQLTQPFLITVIILHFFFSLHYTAFTLPYSKLAPEHMHSFAYFAFPFYTFSPFNRIWPALSQHDKNKWDFLNIATRW